MSYLSFFSPLLKEIGQNHAFLSRSYAVWGPDTFFHGSLHDLWGRKTSHGFGDTDVHETSKNIRISADLPGIKKENIHVKCIGNVLTLEGERKDTGELMNDIYGNMERSFGSIYKSIRLPPGVDHQSITAKYQDGVLTVVIPKPETMPTSTKETIIQIDCHVYSTNILKHLRSIMHRWRTRMRHTLELHNTLLPFLPYQNVVLTHDQTESPHPYYPWHRSNSELRRW